MHYARYEAKNESQGKARHSRPIYTNITFIIYVRYRGEYIYVQSHSRYRECHG